MNSQQGWPKQELPLANCPGGCGKSWNTTRHKNPGVPNSYSLVSVVWQWNMDAISTPHKETWNLPHELSTQNLKHKMAGPTTQHRNPWPL